MHNNYIESCNPKDHDQAYKAYIGASIAVEIYLGHSFEKSIQARMDKLLQYLDAGVLYRVLDKYSILTIMTPVNSAVTEWAKDYKLSYLNLVGIDYIKAKQAWT